MNRYDLVVFDVDGTLLDTTEGFTCAFRYMLSECKLPEVSDEVIHAHNGPPIHSTLKKLFDLDDENIKKCVGVFRDRYSTVDLLKATPYEGIFDAMKTISDNGIKIAVATYKREDYALKVIEHFGFDKFSASSHGADFENKLTKTDIINKCIEECDIVKNRVAMIGDTMYDAIGARDAEVSFIGVSYGFGFHRSKDAYSHGAVYSAKSPEDLAKYLISGR